MLVCLNFGSLVFGLGWGAFKMVIGEGVGVGVLVMISVS